MKTVFIFIGLKIAEILGAIAVFTLLSFGYKLIQDTGNYWINGLAGIGALVLIIGGILMIILIINENIKWAKRLSRGKN